MMLKVDLANRKAVWGSIFAHLDDERGQASKDYLAALIRCFSQDVQISFDPDVERIGYIIDYFKSDVAPKFQGNKRVASQALLNYLDGCEETYINSSDEVGPVTKRNVQDKFCQYVRYLIANNKETLRDEVKTKAFFSRLLAY